jgi:hypothetical protein
LRRTFLQTTTENQIVAPQAGIAWRTNYLGWSFQVQSTALAGFNESRVDQQSGVGFTLIRRAVNRVFTPVFSQQSVSHSDFSPGSELRAEACYSLTDALSLLVARSTLFFYNILLAENRTKYVLPNFGVTDPADQHLLTQDLCCGVEYVH